ncbi:hypothetical protein SAMD00024442_33_24, partial [Candidatus Symbiothrix dinenymphae]
PSPDVPSPDAPSPDAPSPDAPSPDAPSPDAPSPDAPSPDAPSPDAPSPDAPSPDAPSPDAPSPDAPSPAPDEPSPAPKDEPDFVPGRFVPDTDPDPDMPEAPDPDRFARAVKKEKETKEKVKKKVKEKEKEEKKEKKKEKKSKKETEKSKKKTKKSKEKAVKVNEHGIHKMQHEEKIDKLKEWLNNTTPGDNPFDTYDDGLDPTVFVEPAEIEEDPPPSHAEEVFSNGEDLDDSPLPKRPPKWANASATDRIKAKDKPGDYNAKNHKGVDRGGVAMSLEELNAHMQKVYEDWCTSTSPPPLSPLEVSLRDPGAFAGTSAVAKAPSRVVLRANEHCPPYGKDTKDKYDVDGDGEADSPGGQAQETKAKKVLNVFDGVSSAARDHKKVGEFKGASMSINVQTIKMDNTSDGVFGGASGVAMVSDFNNSVALRGSIGTGIELDQEGSDTDNSSDGSTTDRTHNYSFGFVLAETGNTDELSVDYGIDPLSGTYMFRLRGGRTSCPYEGERKTKFYAEGEYTLHPATMKIEVPKLEVDNAYRSDIPTDGQGVFTLKLQNESESHETGYFVLSVDASSNPYGAVVKMDGEPLVEGRKFTVPFGTVVPKTVTIERGASDSCEHHISLILASECDGSASSSTILHASFQMEDSEVRLSTPKGNNWVLNGTDADAKLPLLITDYDVSKPNFGYIELQSRSANQSWQSALSEKRFYATDIEGNTIAYEWERPTDGTYELRAHLVRETDVARVSDSYSTAIRGIVDAAKPQVLGTPTPVDGILTPKDEISVLFNEDIDRSGFADYSHETGEHITVTALTVQTDQHGNELEIPNYVAEFSGSTAGLTIPSTMLVMNPSDSYLLEFWFRGAPQADVALFTGGADTNITTVGFNENGRLTLQVKEISYLVSQTDFLDSKWHHFALNVLYGNGVFVYVDGKNYKQLPKTTLADGMAGNKFTLGSSFRGGIDEFRLWRGTRSAELIRGDMNHGLDGTEAGLEAYFPFENTLNNQGVLTSTPTWLDKKSGIAATLTSVTLTDADAPPLKPAREPQSVRHTAVASRNRIAITLTAPPASIENSTLHIALQNVQDIHGNKADPITWTAYVNTSRLVWDIRDKSITKNYLEEVVFEAKIANTSGLQETWSVKGLPTWLSVSKKEGTLRALSDEKLTFTVSATTPMGIHEATVYLTGNDGIDAPMKLQVEVTDQQPDWTVNPAAFRYSMNLIGELLLNGAPLENSKSLVAAFVTTETGEEQCVGVVPLTHRNEAYLVEMTIYGNEREKTQQALLHFKAYDASAGVVYSKVTTENPTEIPFIGGETYGFDSPVKMNIEQEYVEQRVHLARGWTWVSLNTLPVGNDTLVASVFAPVKAQTLQAKDRYYIVRPTATGWAGNMEGVGAGRMYKMQMTESTTLPVNGKKIEPDNVPITVHSGWTWLAYTPNFNMSLNEALADLQPMEDDVIKSQSGFATYINGGWLGSMENMEAGTGYLYRSKASVGKVFRYPANPSSIVHVSATAAATTAATVDPTHWKPISAAQYSGNMSIIAEVRDNEELLTRAEVAVFAGEECRGVAKTNDKGMLFISVAGDADVPLTFRVYDTTKGVEREVMQEERYQSDAILGAVKEPYIIQSITTPQSTNIRIKPTRVKYAFVAFADNGKTLRSIAIYDAKGQLVQRISDVKASTKKVDVVGLAPNVYLVTVETTDGERLMARIVKE